MRYFMNIFIIGGFGYNYIKLEKWLPKRDNRNYYFLVKSHHYDEFFEKLKNRDDINLIKIEKWYDSNDIELFIYQFSQKERIDRIISLREEEVVRVAKIRKFLEIPGLQPFAAKLFRDKFEMKKFVRNNGIKTADYWKVNSIIDALESVKNDGYNFPYILKPIDGAGSKNTFVLNCISDIENIEAEYFNNSILESFVSGEVYHIDALYTQNTCRYISAAKYINNPLEFKKGKSTASMFLTQDVPETSKIIEFSKNVCSIMPLTENCIIHLEVFYNGLDIIFNEIAIRLGGGRIINIVEREFSLNLLEEFVRAECGFTYDNVILPEWTKPRGFLLVVPKTGVLTKMPSSIPEEGIDSYEVFAKPGQSYSGAISSIQATAAVEVHEENNEKLEKKILKLEKWFSENIEYEK